APSTGSSASAASACGIWPTPARSPASRSRAGEERPSMMTDPIADMLTRIRNANVAMHDEVNMPASKQKVALATILQREGYISGYAVAPSTKGPGDVLTINMKYS